MRTKMSSLAGWMAGVSLASATFVAAEPVAVRFPETPYNRALVLRSLDGKLLAQGGVTVTVGDGRVTSQVVFNFTDGSAHDETTVFSQNDVFRLLSYRLVQKGPAFRSALVMTLDTKTGRAIVRHSEGNGPEEVEEEALDLSSDVANGMMIPVLKNVGPATASAAASWVAATPEPRHVRLAISNAGAEPYPGAGSDRRAIHYIVKAEIGGVAGLLAPLVGRQPPDTHVWILEGAAPVFVKSEGPLSVGGPVWRIEVP
jgi:hypothetical protein